MCLYDWYSFDFDLNIFTLNISSCQIKRGHSAYAGSSIVFVPTLDNPRVAQYHSYGEIHQFPVSWGGNGWEAI